MDVRPFNHSGVTILTRGTPTDMGLFIEVGEDRYYFWNQLAADFLTVSHPLHVLDIGAHIGSWSVWFKHLFSNPIEIAAVELEADNYAVLAQNVAKLDGVSAYHARLGYDKDAQFAQHDDTGTHHVISPSVVSRGVDPLHFKVRPLTVRTLSIQNLLDFHEWKSVDVMKLDCEGSEIDILLNATDDELRCVKRIVGERHQTRDEFDRLIGERLYSLYDVEHRDHPSAAHLGFFYATLKTAPTKAEALPKDDAPTEQVKARSAPRRTEAKTASTKGKTR